MTRIAFIGLGNMGGGMAARQVVGGREVHAFDLSEAAVKKAVAAGAFEAGSIAPGGRDGGRGHHHAAGRAARAEGL
jgi:3-hydroxyisobutyrate dehydrogenase